MQFHDPDLTALQMEQGPLVRWMRRWHIDLPLLFCLLLLSGAAFVILYSASGQSLVVVGRQCMRLVLALGIMVTFAQISPRRFREFSPALYGVGVALLAAVLLMGMISKGAQRWLDLGILRFQPSELMKIATPMMVAWFLSHGALPPNFRRVLIALVVIMIPAALIARQPDLGTAVLVAASGGAVIFLAGIPWHYLLVMTGLGGALLPVLWYFMHDYQRNRILTMLNPEADPLGKGYHIIQSKIAIGSGGIYGKGWTHGTQAQLEFLPEKSTDFIFAVFAEEFGLIGCLILLLIYLLVLGRCFYIVLEAQDIYSRLLSGALTATFFVYVFVNIGMVIGILPVVGVPLPLVSYGGTSMVTLLAGFGILMSIHTHRRRMPV
ncbi:MAG: rod shape-determining protein RodA [Pseudomonadota bacterium]|jgi:rod shape determining protein RodA